MARTEISQIKPVVAARNLETEVSRNNSDVQSEIAAELDVLGQFRVNMQQVEDLNARLRFVINEVSAIIKRN